jgi:hypothetical protein
MLHQPRRRLRVLAAAVLVSMSVVTGWSTLAHELDCYDHDTAPAFIVHDESSHAFQNAAPSASERPVHCVLCHWTRTFALGFQPSVVVLHASSAYALTVQTADGGLLHPVSAVQPPLRAPPAHATSDLVA